MACRALSNCHRSIGLSALRIDSVASSRSAARRRAWAAGSWVSSAPRIRSIAASASSGRNSHGSEPRSHSFGPREPKSAMNFSYAATQSAAAGTSASRSSRPSTPASNAASTSGVAVAWRASAHIAVDGAAESTVPIPPSSETSWSW